MCFEIALTSSEVKYVSVAVVVSGVSVVAVPFVSVAVESVVISVSASRNCVN